MHIAVLGRHPSSEEALLVRIAMMVRGYIAAPGPADIVYAPIDLAVALSEGLEKLGHQVDFYGPAGTRLNTHVRTRGIRALIHDRNEFAQLLTRVDLLSHYIPGLWDQYLSSEMFRRAKAGEYDILHFHHPEAAMPYAHLYPKIPVIYTLHDPIEGWWQELFSMFDSPNQFYISISDNQRKKAPKLQFVSTVYNGIDPKKFKFSANHEDYLLFVGRIVPEKGAHKAIEVAEKTGSRLLIIGPTFADHLYYFESKIRPRLNDHIQYLGYKENHEVEQYYRNAKALLAPIGWEEPFGLTMVEAMACGTPVIAFKRGSVPEVVVNGKTGFIVGNMREMIDAVKVIDKIKREDCRDHVLANFTLKHMIDGYAHAYKEVDKIMRHRNILSASMLKRPHHLKRHKHKKWL